MAKKETPELATPLPRAARQARAKFWALLFLLLCPASLLAQEPLRAGTIFSATQAPLWAAKEGRYFEKYGIKNLEVIQFSGVRTVSSNGSFTR